MSTLPTASRSSNRSRRNVWWFRLITVVIGSIAGLMALLGADIYLHHRLEPYAAVNIWGYRGKTVGRKQPGERRILVIGPSTVFGVGFPPQDAIPAQLENMLRKRPAPPITVVNLGFPGEDAFAYRANLEDYRFLQPDAVIFYGDNNHNGGATPIVLRRLSLVFRMTGYYPLLDTALREKAMSLRYGGDLGAAYRERTVVFKPALAHRVGAAALTAAADIADTLHRTLGPLTVTAETPPAIVETCEAPFTRFCDVMHSAVLYARSLGLAVLVVNSPYVSDGQVHGQQAIQAMLRQRFASDAAVRYLDLGWAIDIRDTRLVYDGLHLTPAGNEIIAARLVEPALALLTR